MPSTVGLLALFILLARWLAGLPLLPQVLPTVAAHHVIFEQIGELAGALSYMHVQLTLNLTAIDQEIDVYEECLNTLRDNVEAQGYLHYKKVDFNLWYQQNLMELLKQQKIQHLAIIDDFHRRSYRFRARLDGLRWSLPQARSRHLHTPEFLVKKKRVAPAMIGLGVIGTFMGLYTQYQLTQLRNELHNTVQKHNRLVTVVERNRIDIRRINQTIEEIIVALTATALSGPAITIHKLHSVEEELDAQLYRAEHTLRSLQLRRLAMNFLEPASLTKLYNRLLDQAKAANYKLMLEHHSDLFQLETSYFSDGENVHLLVHVPMIPSDTLMRLFRLHPFPLPLDGDRVLIPANDQDILAISLTDNKKKSMELRYVDLLGCHQVNQVYLCEQQGVMRNDLNTSCLGALYLHDFSAAAQLCHLTVHTSGEVVQQLPGNRFLAYSPVDLLAPVTCINTTKAQADIHLLPGVNEFFLQPGCRTSLRQHLLISDLILKPMDEFIHYDWKWDSGSASDLRKALSESSLQSLQNHGLFLPTIRDLQQFQVTRHLLQPLNNSLQDLLEDSPVLEDLRVQHTTHQLPFIISFAIVGVFILIFIFVLSYTVSYFRKLLPARLVEMRDSSANAVHSAQRKVVDQIQSIFAPAQVPAQPAYHMVPMSSAPPPVILPAATQ